MEQDRRKAIRARIDEQLSAMQQASKLHPHDWRTLADLLISAFAAAEARIRALEPLIAEIEILELKRGVNDELTSSGYVYKRFGFNICKTIVLERLQALTEGRTEP